MKIELYEPHLAERRGFDAFFRYLYRALIAHAGARALSEPRPLPRMMVPREHQSAWARFDGELVFFDFSDHIHLIDVDALRIARVYFKANLNLAVARRILAEKDVTDLIGKMVPFAFFSESLDLFFRDARRRALWRLDRPKYDLCFVMGVYENPFLRGERSPFEHPDEPLTPARYHFWIRWHLMDEMKRAGINGIYRLTSRANPQIEDGVHVYSNISRRAFSRAISKGRITMVCTLPHAVFPWKVSESFALGRPIILDCEPVTEIPQPFRPLQSVHYLTIFGRLGDPDTAASWDDPRSYRLLPRLSLADIRNAVESIRSRLADVERLREMGREAKRFAEEAYNPSSVVKYICEQVRARLSPTSHP